MAAAATERMPTSGIRAPKELTNEMEVDERVEPNDSEDLYTSLKTLEKKLEFLQIQVRRESFSSSSSSSSFFFTSLSKCFSFFSSVFSSSFLFGDI